MGRLIDVRLLSAACGAALLWTVGDLLSVRGAALPFLPLVGLVLGFLLGPVALSNPLRRAGGRLVSVPAVELLAGLLGAGIGLILSALITLPLYRVLGRQHYWWLPLLVTAAVSYGCLRLFVLRAADVGALFARDGQRVEGADGHESGGGYRQILLDTSAIIDGRIADISQTGFLSAELVIPRFVLDELQHIAGSSDAIRRNRGRRGLDMLNKMRKDSLVPILILNTDVPEVQEVDSKLVMLARSLHAPIMTQDSGLYKVAELQGVVALNINSLAHAVRPPVLPGEEMAVHIVQQGREVNQGVGYLDDGTMIVVEDGQRYLNREVEIIVTRVLQTVAGRMIFAHPKPQGNGR